MGGDPGELDPELALEVQRRAELRYRELAAYLPDYVAAIDRSRRFRWINRVAPGISREELLASGRVGDHIDTQAERDRVASIIDRVFETGRPDEFVVEAYGDGESKYFYLTRVVPAAPENGEPRVLLLTADVTRQKLFETELRASEQRFASLLHGLPDYVVEIDRDRRIRFVNRIHPDTSADAVIGRRMEDLVTPDMRDELVAKLEHLFTTGEDVRWSTETVVDSGSYVVHALRLAPDRAVAVGRDVTTERQAIVKLHASEERLSRALQAGKIAVWEIEVASGTIEHIGWTTALPGAAGVMRSDVWTALVVPEDLDRVRRAFFDHVAGRSAELECEYRLRNPASGEIVDVLSRGRLVERPGGVRVVAGTAMDVTAARAAEAERRALERHIEHAQRLDSIGVLAGGVAHDFNNLLTVISSSAECARKLSAQGRSPAEELEAITQAVSRAAALTQQLLAFGRRTALETETIDVDGLVRGIAEMAGRVFSRSIEIAVEAAPEPVHVRGDRQRLAQVILNLCVNARDAMPDGGRLTLAVRAGDREATIEVADTGTGIAASDRPRIFEPFFTTKPVGEGTGLGLAVAHGIVQQHGGSIEVESDPGRGTRFAVHLPRSFDLTPAATVVLEPPRGGTETILVADDEPGVLRAATRALEGAGYRVVAATDGAAAVEAFRTHEGTIDLVLLDVVMPRLDGWSARSEIRRIAPGARVLLTSGYSASVIPSDGAGDVRMLPKPYGPDALLRAVRAALDEG